ncbi:MAG: HDOD domain-containing protein [Phycisphaerae bacterium]|nr:HDOD domain-containing protein [Phycisphaerae bacterium]
MTTVDAILGRVREIQPLPGTVLKLITVVNDPKSTVEQIVETIRYDQAVTSQMLRIVNSAFFGLTRQVYSLSDAMRCLGTTKVLQLVMAVHTNTLLCKSQPGYGLPPGTLWKHSVGVAIACSSLSEHLDFNNKSLLFTAGLLHDIGKVILNEYVAEEFAEIAQRVNENHLSFAEAEKQILGFSHDEIGGRVAEKWQLPEAITLGIRHHHNPAALDPPNSLVDALHLADCVCLLLGIGLGADELCYRADERVMARYGMGEPDLEVIGAQTLMELKRVENMFDQASTSQELDPALARQEV